MSVRDNAHRHADQDVECQHLRARGLELVLATRLDIFATAAVDNLSFLTEIMFEGFGNNIGVDVERMELSYQFKNWLRVRAGRSHMAWGYYNDTYHHGNIFELTTSRPYSVNFEDSSGIILSHCVGAGVDGTFALGQTDVRYDVDACNPHAPDITAVSVQYPEDTSPTVNARLRWMPFDGFIVGVNAMRDVIPPLASGTTAPSRPETEELVGGAHVVYMGHHMHVDIEGFYMRHNPTGAPTTISEAASPSSVIPSGPSPRMSAPSTSGFPPPATASISTRRRMRKARSSGPARSTPTRGTSSMPAWASSGSSFHSSRSSSRATAFHATRRTRRT